MAKPGARKDPIIRAQVAALLGKGLTPRQVAQELDYSVQRIYILRKELAANKERQAV